MQPGYAVQASSPARVDLAGGTLDLWPLHVLHPGSLTVNLAIDRRASCRVRRGAKGFRVLLRHRKLEFCGESPQQLLREPQTALAGALLEELGVTIPLEIEFFSSVPYGSGLGGSSALTVAMAAALSRSAGRSFDGAGRVDFLRDVETRVLGKPAGVQDFYPALEGGLHRLKFETGRTVADRWEVDAQEWEQYLTLFDTAASHSSGMNNWEIFRARLEGDREVSSHLDEIRDAALRMAEAVAAGDFLEMGKALRQEWEARRLLAPVVSSPEIERAVEAALSAGAWGGKACGAGGGGCIVFLSPPERTAAVREALAALGEGSVLPVRAEPKGLRLEVEETLQP